MSAYHWMDDDGNVWASPLVDHEARGKCSGIPACCVEHYVTKILTNQASPLDRLDGWGYRPCPQCVASGNRIEVRGCRGDDCICGQWADRKPL